VIVPVYEIAFAVAVVLFGALAFMQVIMRRQVHNAGYGNQEISPWDVRFSNNLFGCYGIWNLHKRAYERSGLRFSFLALCLALLVSVTVAVCDFLYLRYGL